MTSGFSAKANRAGQRGLLSGLLLCAVLFVLCYVAVVGTPFGHLLDDRATAGFQGVNPRIAGLNDRVLDKVTRKAVLGAAGLIFGVALARRRTLAGLVAVAGFGVAVVGAEVFKKTLPWLVLIPDDRLLKANLRIASYPSGHATIGTAFALGLLMVLPARWRPWLGIAAGGLSSLFAAGVLFAGWHRSSDAIGALTWSGSCMSLAALVAVRLRGQPCAPATGAGYAVFGSIGSGLLLIVGSSLALAIVRRGRLLEMIPFFASTNLVIAGAFLLTAWYAWQLRGVDWTSTANGRE